MKRLGIASACAVLLALVAFGDSGGIEVRAEPTEVPVSPPAERAVAPTAPAAPQEASAEPEVRVQEQSVEPPAPRRRSRRRFVNRYPGPIPTPAEWVPPEGPVRIALQAGHWRANEAPNELRGLRDNGTSSRGKAEWEVNLEIARRAAAMLEPMGYEVDILPAVVPPDYRAHLFISIHADGSNDPRATGFRVGSPRQDATGRASQIARLLERSYGEATGIRRLADVTRRMSNYYAFNYRRYEHALHPMTVAVILETGFLTSASDWRVIVDDPDRSARGIVAAVEAFEITQLSASVSASSEALD
ncbi:MAG: N-acetylmuramoyl-L-alanine amidase [Gemmatimonadota bacterium]|nr:N-acetylmuramoyl-L-alanine amidase [Gemmatimonadota bacterium]